MIKKHFTNTHELVTASVKQLPTEMSDYWCYISHQQWVSNISHKDVESSSMNMGWTNMQLITLITCISLYSHTEI